MFGLFSSNKKYIIHYCREVCYEDGKLSTAVGSDIKEAKSLKDILDQIENNDNFLSMREDDSIDFGHLEDSQIVETSLNFFILDEDGKKILYPTDACEFEIIVGMYKVIESDDKLIYLDEEGEEFIVELGFDNNEFGYDKEEKVISINKYFEGIDIKYTEFFSAKLITKLKRFIPEKFIIGDFNVAKGHVTKENCDEMYPVLVKFKCLLPIYALLDNFLEISADRGLEGAISPIITFDVTSKIYQICFDGDFASGIQLTRGKAFEPEIITETIGLPMLSAFKN